MVFGACLVDADREGELREAGFRDSKKVPKKKREELRDTGMEMTTILAHRVVEVAPAQLDAKSLNVLGKEVIVDLAVELLPDILVLDAPVPPKQIPKYVADITARLAARGVTGMTIVAENGADDTHPCCSAASIFAKVHRDAELRRIEADLGEPLGSGYPGDPHTVAFLRNRWARDHAWPDCVRTKWETVRRIVAESAQGQLF
jgi:ribonuclease HII